MHRRYRRLSAFVVIIALVGVAGTAQGATPTDTTALQDAVVVGDAAGTFGICEHLRALQEIADGANGGNRATGTQGHEDSVEYVVSQLDTSYWNVTTQPFTADVFTELAPPVLAATPPADPAWVVNVGLRHDGVLRRPARSTTRRWRSSTSSSRPHRRAPRAPAARTPTSRLARPAWRERSP